MPKSLKVSSGERVDLVDYVQGSKTYTQDSQKFLIERLTLDQRARIVDGFRVRIEDQVLNPGLVTVFNGVAFDRAGQLLNNEDTVNDSRSVTLLGLGTHYLEVEFVETTSDTDARFFWDPTIPNTSPEPDGSEFSVNVATRTSPDWRLVHPVSTIGFEQTTNPNSLRIPVMQLVQTGPGIVVGPSNPNLQLVFPGSVLENDIIIGATSLRVPNCREFPTTPFDVTVDLGGALPEARTVNVIDRVNNILQISVGVSNDHLAGSIVRVSSGVASFVAQNNRPSNAVPHPDPAQRLFQARELRGSGLMQSKEDYIFRDDMNVSSLKDHVDFLAAQIREMKFGSPRPDVINSRPPNFFFGTPRYFDQAGSITGARTNSVSIGDGFFTFGDFNGSDQEPFIAALASLPATGGTVYVKYGVYDFTAPVNVSKVVRFVGEGRSSTRVNNTSVADPAFIVATDCSFEHLTLTGSASFSVCLDVIVASRRIDLSLCTIDASIRFSGVPGFIRADRVRFEPVTATASVFISTAGGSCALSHFTNCLFITSGVLFSCAVAGITVTSCTVFCGGLSGMFAPTIITDQLTGIVVDGCLIQAVSNIASSTNTQTVTDVRFINNSITVSNLTATDSLFRFNATTVNSGFQLSNNIITVSASSATTDANASAIVSNLNGVVAGLRVDNNRVSAPFGATVILYWGDAPSTTRPVRISGNSLFRGSELVRLGAGSPSAMTTGEYLITDNYHDNDGSTATAIGVNLRSSAQPAYLKVVNNTFINYYNSAAGERKGVHCTSASMTGIEVFIDNNTFQNIGTTNSTVAYGVHFGTVSTVPIRGSVKITNNLFSGIGGTLCAGVLCAPNSVGNGIDFQVMGNTMFQIGAVTASNTSQAYGVYFSVVTRGVISNNEISNVSCPSASIGEASGIRLLSTGSSVLAAGVVVSANRVYLIEGPSSGVFPLVGSCVYGSGTIENLSITDNTCSQLGAATAGRVSDHLILVSDTLRNVRIVGNIVQSTASATVVLGGLRGIRVQKIANSANMRNIVVADNMVEMNSTQTWVGIEISAGGASNGISVVNNTIRETIVASNQSGIIVTGHNTGEVTHAVTITGNVLNGAKTGGLTTNRVGILLADCNTCTVSQNTVDWSEPSVAEGRGIWIHRVVGGPYRKFACVGNIIHADGAAATHEIDISTANMQDGILHANIVGDAVTAGTINPAAAAGGWTYGAAALTNFNKLT